MDMDTYTEESSDKNVLDNEDMEDNSAVVSNSSVKEAQEALAEEHDVLSQKFVAACQAGDLATVKELLESGAVELGVSDKDASNVTGLHWASINNRLSVVKYLVEDMGAVVDCEGGELNATPLHWACRYGLVYIVDFLLSHGADPLREDSQGFNALHLAVHSSNIMLVIYVLVFSAIESRNGPVSTLGVDCADPNGRTGLHWAAYQGDSLSVDVLLKFKASVRAVDSQGFTPLHWALIRGQKECLKRLIEEGSDLFAKTNEGKTCFDVAHDMANTAALNAALYECGFDNSGQALYLPFSAKWAKVMTFFYPYLLVGAVVKIWSDSHPLISLLSCLILFFVSQFFLKNYLLPCYSRSQTPFLKSPFLAGLFSGTAFWVIISWITTILPSTFQHSPFTNFLFLLAASTTCFCFQKSMFKNPGLIESPDNEREIQQNIKDLLKIGKYDAKHFCIYTFIRKPLRSKYSSFSQKCVARFDHTCPWVYNDVGLRNHKIFLFFVISLELALLLYFNLVSSLFYVLEENRDDELQCSFLSDKFCTAFTYTPFVFVLSIWCLFQFIWLSFLLFSQAFQIAKGVTTLELSMLSRHGQAGGANPYYSSAPSELVGADAINASAAATGLQQKNCLTTLCALTGLDQFRIALKQSLGFQDSSTPFDIPTDYGFKQNCMDFWFATGDDHVKFRNLLKVPYKDEANLNGRPVEYYKLYNLPDKKITYESAV